MSPEARDNNCVTGVIRSSVCSSLAPLAHLIFACLLAYSLRNSQEKELCLQIARVDFIQFKPNVRGDTDGCQERKGEGDAGEERKTEWGKQREKESSSLLMLVKTNEKKSKSKMMKREKEERINER